MSTKNELRDQRGPVDGGQDPGGRINRFSAPGDKQGHPTGFILWLDDGDLLITSAHPHSTFIFHGQGRRCWLEG
ncbi:hypothetical protein [Pseudomonas taiwanensis]|uniref:hypothetical protein n=1 Tax=Pseudomonas taiwanensis TaxID=470150 RepID=UPI0015BF2AA3|nr:hypothetical protein [Pseudomonas taiwanensis]